MALCFLCGIETPLALRLPGIYSQLDPAKRGRLWHCKQHEPDAFARRDAKIGLGRSADHEPGESVSQGQAVGRKRGLETGRGGTKRNAGQGDAGQRSLFE